MADVDYYEILDVRPTATAAEIKAAYHRAVRAAHPDAGGTAGMFRLVNDAYRTLSDPRARAAYDAEMGTSRPDDVAHGAAAPPESDWGEEVRWEAGGPEPHHARQAAETLREEDFLDYGPSWSERWVETPAGKVATRWGGWATAALFGALAAVLFLAPDWIRPEAAGSDVLGWLLDHSLVLWIVVIIYAILAVYAFLGLLWTPMTVFHLSVLVVVVVGWPLAYWSLAETRERLAFVGVAIVWIVYAAAMAAIPVWQGARLRPDGLT
ncbi:J domain-containing protein [Jiangella rhizosphaerae]|uniref:J domain-containing protein n=1 Tax=Jiangella rhizosphaerae TaxID=2293569 RepID=A0A418KW70_9ACTN|nr:J domain-containing protein [Jiangella rhizosphaerae]RIQ33645.1 J domain-containing protein [Jiangella rhizosphaerae]